jgi:hypothetical protein
MIDHIDNNLLDLDDDIVDTHIKNNLKLYKENEEDKKIKIPRTISCKNISILEDTDTKLEIPRKTPYKEMNAEENMLEFNDKIIIQYNSNPKKEDNKTIINRKIVDAKLTTKTRLNMSNMFDDFNCYCCKNYLTIHDNNVINYFLKYDTMNKTVIPRSSNSIRTLYKLRPDLFINENLENLRFLKNFDKKNFIHDQSYEFKYELWMFDLKNKDTIIMCSICDKELCQSHYQYNPYHNKKCKFCDKIWSICSWCLYDNFSENFIKSFFFHEEVFCEILHK